LSDELLGHRPRGGLIAETELMELRQRLLISGRVGRDGVREARLMQR
jgi:hypothetical protein